GRDDPRRREPVRALAAGRARPAIVARRGAARNARRHPLPAGRRASLLPVAGSARDVLVPPRAARTPPRPLWDRRHGDLITWGRWRAGLPVSDGSARRG